MAASWKQNPDEETPEAGGGESETMATDEWLGVCAYGVSWETRICLRAFVSKLLRPLGSKFVLFRLVVKLKV